MMTREDTLKTAVDCVCGMREEQYGSPEDNFRTIASLWQNYLTARGCRVDALYPHDVAAMMALLKIARVASGQSKPDNWVDLAGYAACGCEIQTT